MFLCVSVFCGGFSLVFGNGFGVRGFLFWNYCVFREGVIEDKRR